MLQEKCLSNVLQGRFSSNYAAREKGKTIKKLSSKGDFKVTMLQGRCLNNSAGGKMFDASRQ